MRYEIQFQTPTQGWTTMQPESLYSGSYEEMEELLSGQLTRPPFNIEGVEYQIRCEDGAHKPNSNDTVCVNCGARLR